MKLQASGEDYLESVLVLQKKKGIVRSFARPSACYIRRGKAEPHKVQPPMHHFLHGFRRHLPLF